MHRCLIICALALAACGPDPALIPAELLDPCPGWQGKRPETEGQLIRAAAAEKGGRLCANSKLASIAKLQ
ncbi:MAG: hypothetical protein U1E58_10240 [Tabrizicola sp.]